MALFSNATTRGQSVILTGNFMRTIGIIPARMGSTRFPGKPLAHIIGMPMIGHVYERCRKSAVLESVWVATCDQEIVDYVTSIGGRAVMTSDRHERASDRTAEAMEKIEQETGNIIDIVVMIQGDEPMVTPAMIDAAVQPFIDDPSINVVNLMAPLESAQEHDDVNEVKVVVDRLGNALYFSREAIPSRWKQGIKVPMNKQVCIIPFRKEFLLKFNALEPTPLEIAESVDMMRVLEHGYRVRMVSSPTYPTYSVDTPEDLKDVEELMQKDSLRAQYSS